MGDISTETSMEDILSSIKRIIAEEGDATPAGARGRKSIRTAHAPREEDGDEVLELREPAEPRPPVERPARFASSEPRMSEFPRPEPVRSEPPRPEARAPEPEPAEPAAAILSERTAEASRAKLDALSRMVVRPETPGADTLQNLVCEMLRPMLRDWLDANLPGIVETMVAREIARISNRD